MGGTALKEWTLASQGGKPEKEVTSSVFVGPDVIITLFVPVSHRGG